MILVASGELGDQVDWEPGFEALGEVRKILSQLEELGEEESIDWDTIIGVFWFSVNDPLGLAS
jgi:hypothetical protein